MNSIFYGKNILVAVCGSVSFYKSYELISQLKKLGANVRVALSEGVLNFTKVISFESICDFPILCQEKENWQAGINHIAYAKADLIIIAPASVNTINKLANGICDNIFMQTLIASRAKLVIAPAANDAMLEHFSTKKSIEFLKSNNAIFVEPIVKKLACGDIGKGGLADINFILYAAAKALYKNIFNGKKVLITGGATIENIDDVRAITNHSSGKMSKALADAFYFAGANVSLVASFEVLNMPYEVIKFKSSDELAKITQENAKRSDLIIMCAAVSDFVPKDKIKGKIKKANNLNELNITLKPNIDILSSLKTYKCKKIGFKLEMDKKTAYENAQNMLKQKKLDAVCLNILSSCNDFGSDKNKISFITQDKCIDLGKDTKNELALKIVQKASELL